MDRSQLFQAGQAVRHRLGRSASVRPALAGVPGYQQLSTELIFGSIWARPGLALRDRALVTLATLNVLQRLSQLPSYVAAALALGITPVAIQETLLQGALLVEFPAVTNALLAAQAVIEQQEAASGFAAVPEAQPESLDQLAQRGALLRAALRMDDAGASHASADLVIRVLAHLSEAYEFGVIWQRPGLDRKSRALVGLAGATAMGDVEQAGWYLSAARATGWSLAEVQEALLQVAPYAGFPPVLRVVRLLDRWSR